MKKKSSTSLVSDVPLIATDSKDRGTHRRSVNAFNGGFAVDVDLPQDQRPLTGADIEKWRGDYRLRPADVAFYMALTSPGSYLKLVNGTRIALPMTNELLLRAYILYPTPPSWEPLNVNDIYMALYGDLLAQARSVSDVEHERVRQALYKRFPALIGRQASSSYRWLASGQTEPTAGVLKLLSKMDIKNPGFLERLESLAVEAWRLRGMDINKTYPMPVVAEAVRFVPEPVKRVKPPVVVPAPSKKAFAFL